MSQINVPDVRVWTIIKADEKDVGISDVHSGTDYAGKTVIKTRSRVERSWKCWIRDEDSGEESWFQGSGNCPYLEGHRVALASYEGELVGQHNINMNKTILTNPAAVQNFFDVIIILIWSAVRTIGAPIAAFASLLKVFYKEDGILQRGPFPDSAKYTNKYGIYSLFPLTLVMLSYLNPGKDGSFLGLAMLISVLALTVISFKYLRQAAKAHAAFQSLVASALVKAASDDQAKRKAARAQTAAV